MCGSRLLVMPDGPSQVLPLVAIATLCPCERRGHVSQQPEFSHQLVRPLIWVNFEETARVSRRLWLRRLAEPRCRSRGWGRYGDKGQLRVRIVASSDFDRWLAHQAASARRASVSNFWPIWVVPAEFSLFTSTYWNCSMNRIQSFGYQSSATAPTCCLPP